MAYSMELNGRTIFLAAKAETAMGDYIGLHTAMLLSAVPMLAGALLLIFIPYPQKAN